MLHSRNAAGASAVPTWPFFRALAFCATSSPMQSFAFSTCSQSLLLSGMLQQAGSQVLGWAARQDHILPQRKRALHATMAPGRAESCSTARAHCKTSMRHAGPYLGAHCDADGLSKAHRQAGKAGGSLLCRGARIGGGQRVSGGICPLGHPWGAPADSEHSLNKHSPSSVRTRCRAMASIVSDCCILHALQVSLHAGKH